MIYRLAAVLTVYALSSQGHGVIKDVYLKLELGEIIGQRVVTDEDKVIDQYLSIPYATPPVGDLRFKRPIPASPWTTPLNVSSFPLECTQIDRLTFSGVLQNKSLGEDCLYLSVHTPVGPKEPLPVLVWIHGGGFVGGKISETSNLPENLVGTYGIVSVAIQYRLGALGFLYLDDDDAPGNMALLDQQLALEWIKENIAAFGGDSERITLMGESAGAASVNYHLLAPQSEGLFHRAILQSGAATSSWAYTEPDTLIHRGRELLSVLSCEKSNVKESLACLRTMEALDIVQAESNLTSAPGPKFTPTNDGQFIQHSPKYIMDNDLFHEVPILGGVTRDEGDFFLLMRMPELLQPVPPNITDDAFLAIYRKADPKTPEHVVYEMLNFYKQYLSNETGQEVTNLSVLRAMFGDFIITCPALSTIYKFADRSPKDTFMYVLDYRVKGVDVPLWVGATHGFDLPLVFGHHFDPAKCLSTEDQIVRQHLATYWTNFIKSGSPNDDGTGNTVPEEWLPMWASNRTYLVIDNQWPWHHHDSFHEDLCKLLS